MIATQLQRPSTLLLSVGRQRPDCRAEQRTNTGRSAALSTKCRFTYRLSCELRQVSKIALQSLIIPKHLMSVMELENAFNTRKRFHEQEIPLSEAV